MVDKQHCFMNPDDEREYEEFYDFSIAYAQYPQKEKPELEKLNEADEAKENNEEWEDVDFEDADEEEVKKEVAEIKIEAGESNSEGSFSIIDSKTPSKTGTDFNVVDSDKKEE